jgi:hypothetical protein
MFLVFKLSFVVDILAFFDGDFLGYSLKNLAILFLIICGLYYKTITIVNDNCK